MKICEACSLLSRFPQVRSKGIAVLFSVPLLFSSITGIVAFASDSQVPSEAIVAERARVLWESGATNRALEMLDQSIQTHPQALTLPKLRGDILAASRRPTEAVQAYETVLAKTPSALDVRWAKWGVLVRSGQGEEAIAELQHIAQIDDRNPLIYWLMAQELRKLDRLEESLESYEKAVELVPELLGWRLAMARAKFDILDYQGALDDVQDVLKQIPPGSPLEIPARNLLSVIYRPTTDRGRRFKPVFTPDGTAAQRKEWASVRSDAWKLFAAGRYAEAEPLYRKALALNPSDSTAAHQLGLVLVELGRCKEALPVLRKMSALEPTEEEYADAVFRMGQCLVELERWEEALFHFQVLYDAAVEFEESTKHIRIPQGTRVLDEETVGKWLEKVRPHVPGSDKIASKAPAGSEGLSEKEFIAKIEAAPLDGQKPLDKRSSLMGRDADFSWFRYVVPASKVIRNDFPTGDHEFIPINPGVSFPSTQNDIYLVFGLVSSSYESVPLTAQCFLEASELSGEPRAVVQDQVLMSMSDQSGYFLLSRPETGWAPGLYRCGLFEGERTSAYTQVDEVRFRVIEPTRSS